MFSAMGMLLVATTWAADVPTGKTGEKTPPATKADAKAPVDPFAKWEKAIATFEESDAKNPPQPGSIIFLGSSSMVRWPLAKSFPDLPVVNRGFGGSQMHEAAHFARRILKKQSPKQIILYEGDNDVGSGKTPEQIETAFRKLMAEIRSDFPQVPVVLIAIKPSKSRWAKRDTIQQANARLAKVCAELPHCQFCDIYPLMLGADGTPNADYYVADGLHLSAAGYAVWAKQLRPLLISESRKPE
ncbi:GDSL-type esterase/lipase family protein [Tuwongella immobilis]|nr:GDSL-type esterase/lipase family protein [Tuwongella immobilis]